MSLPRLWAIPIRKTTRRYTHATDRAKHAAVEAVRVLRNGICHNFATTQERLPEATAVSA